MARSTIVVLLLIAGLLAQVPSAGAEEPAAQTADEAAARLALMKRSLAIFDVHPLADRATTYRLQPEPIIRFTNPVGASQDGAIFLWLGAGDRPELSVQVFMLRGSGAWLQEFSTLSPSPMIVESQVKPDWTPSQALPEFQPIPGAPRPAETPEQRLRQMRALTQDFAATDDFRDQSWQQLRMLAKPFARYGKPGTDALDGALFCFALGTDPEVFLMIEERTGKDGPEWQYAFARVTIYAVKGMCKGKEVWSLPRLTRVDTTSLDGPFHGRSFKPGE